MKFRFIGILAGLAALGASVASAQTAVPSTAGPRLPLSTVFQGDTKFYATVAKAERENWRALPLGERTIRVARELVGTPYVNYSLEIDDRIESPVPNLRAMDCWTYYVKSLALARMLRFKP